MDIILVISLTFILPLLGITFTMDSFGFWNLSTRSERIAYILCLVPFLNIIFAVIYLVYFGSRIVRWITKSSIHVVGDTILLIKELKNDIKNG